MDELYHFDNTPTKLCTYCHVEKDFSEFAPDKRASNGLQSRCRPCQQQAKHDKLLRNKKPPVQQSLFKVCTRCHKEQLLDCFHCAKFGKNGYAAVCKSCHTLYGKERRQKPGFNQHKMEWHKQRYATVPEFAERQREKSKAWAKANPLKAREQVGRRTARKKQTKHSNINYQHILTRDNYVCYICSQPIDPNARKKSAESLVFDHIIPLQPRLGEPQGTHSEDNIRSAHCACNARKSNKRLEDLTEFDRRGVS